MGYGPVINGKQMPITQWENSWAARANDPIPEHVKRHFGDQHAATHSQRIRLEGSVQWPVGCTPREAAAAAAKTTRSKL